MLFEAINETANKGKKADIDPHALINIDEGTDDFLDEQGRTIRWERVFDPTENEQS